ncbi:hypothetical protein CLAIMM_06693 [Cladophialophora immunda]|nr:hypothetical protein CLAIMM_06693 [Cladophialophora immunda]
MFNLTPRKPSSSKWFQRSHPDGAMLTAAAPNTGPAAINPGLANPKYEARHRVLYLIQSIASASGLTSASLASTSFLHPPRPPPLLLLPITRLHITGMGMVYESWNAPTCSGTILSSHRKRALLVGSHWAVISFG